MSKNYKSKRATGQLVSFLPDSYLDRTSRPIYALTYLLGFMLFYEIGTFLIHPETLTESLAQPQVRVVAFVWVQNLLEFVRFSPRMTWIAAPSVVIIILLALQVTSHTKWQVRISDFIPMTLECVLLAIPLIVLSLLLNRNGSPPASAVLVPLQEVVDPLAKQMLMVDIVTGIGAGIYEELIFRLILICLLMILFQDFLGLQKNNAIFASVLISAVLFSAHHHFFFAGGQFFRGDPFTIGKFVFRALAGVYFAALYAVRGFGITAGTHAFYNILAATLRILVLFVHKA
ncbi:MAG: CPBP family intramembrane metalloprotease [Phycisphaerae bacterium]|nr:CPBP family intramembrane metalloprotease [Phycisphaerae bacterium]